METKTNNIAIEKPETGQKKPSKLLGLYPQKQDGLFMQRIKILGGRINWQQWRRTAELASFYTPDTPLHITTRQDIELHNIAYEDIPAVQAGLTEAGLTIFGACGDTVRNITVDTGCQACKDSFDLMPLAHLVRQYLEQETTTLNLPRKFKISFSGCQHRLAKPYINDLGFVVQDNGLLTLIGAGSLGPKPAAGIELYRDLAPKDVLPLCIASVKVFAQYGDRENRHRARFRHIKERLGEQAFRAELDKSFQQIKMSRRWPEVPLTQYDKNIKLLHRLQLPNGNINPQEALELADFAEPKGITMRINLEHGLELYGNEFVQLPKGLASYADAPVIVACPGATTCPKAIGNSWAVADKIRESLAGRHFPDVRINISGCPNNCAQSAVSDIGLTGALRKRDGVLSYICKRRQWHKLPVS
jgi:sulfite reductase (ferredoxin)